jgi:meso-butanediol dehydrogenase / (S,S)-butanediol dehydrogenase / diacetyl reductase
MEEFLDEVVLITGAGRGRGRELALVFSSLGAIVAANDINPISLDETVELIHQAGGNATSHVFDIAKRMPIEAMVAQVLDHYGRIDILINHAAVVPDESVLEMDEWEFHRTLDVNLGGPFFTIQQVGRVMREHGGGSIVNMISSVRTHDFHKGHAAHSTSQAGLIGLTQAAAGELSAYNIRINAVCDGPLEVGPVPSPAWDTAAFRLWQEKLLGLNPGIQSNLISLVLYLCSMAASTITGQVIYLLPEK